MSRDNAEPLGLAPSVSPAQGPLGSVIDWELLARLGLDPAAEVFAPEKWDPIFGFDECKATRCDQVARRSSGLCWRCDQLWQKEPSGADFAQFCETVPERFRRRRGTALCAVCRTHGHERPVHSHGLCSACENARAKRGQSPDDYVHGDAEFPAATPRPSFGMCSVATCSRFAWRAVPALCEQHHKIWSAAGRPSGRAMHSWSTRQRSVDGNGRVVVLRGLSEQLRLEVLYALQRASEIGRRTRATDVQTAVNVVRAQGVSSICEVSIERLKPRTQSLRFLTFAADQVTLALSHRASEVAKDDWDQRVFGYIPGLLRFGPISQGWLKETAKAWAAERIDTVRTPRVLQAGLRAVRAFSESLRRNRPDGGIDVHLVSRSDLMAFANDLAHLEAHGDLARNTRRSWISHLGRFL